MNDSILQYGNNPDDIIAQMSVGSSRVLYNLQKEVAGWLRTSEDNFPDYRNPKQATPFISPFGGVGKLGYCRVDPRKPNRLLSKSRLCIYWPVFIKEAYDLIYVSVPLAMFFLSFKPLLKMVSPFLVEALHRNYAKCLHRRFAGKYEAMKQSPSVLAEVPIGEEAIARDILKSLSENEDFIRAIQETCCRTYIEKPFDSERRSRFHARGDFPSEQVKLSTLLPLVQRKKLASTVTLPAPKWLPYDLFGHEHIPPMVEELLKAAHVAEVWHREDGWQRNYAINQVNTFGVALLPLEPGGVLFINWDKWYSYRLAAGQQKVYQDAVRSNPHYRQAANHAAVSQFSIILSDVLFKLYPDLHRRALGYGEKTKHLEAKWEKDFNDTVVTAISVKKLIDFRTRLRKMKETLSQKPRRTPRKYSMKRLDYVFPLIIGGEEVMCKAVHTGRKLWFIPPWDMTHAHIFLNPSLQGDVFNPNNLHVGVVYLKDTGETAYDVRFLGNRALSPGTPPDPDVLEQLRQVSARLKRADIKAAVADIESKATGDSSHFSEYEDDFIIRNFRPNMRTETKEALVATCLNRKMGAISRRAMILRRRLISEGVYNLDDLPHGRYNHRIKLEIETAKAEAARKRENHV